MGLREVSSGQGMNGDQSAEVDIVAIHGLNPLNDKDHAFNTWRKPKNADGMLWLQDYLPQSTPNARVFIYGYNSNPVFAASKERFIYHANDLLERLHIARDKDPERPLIMIAHSLGGILAKQALVNAHSNPRYNDIYEATSGLAFFGTPHAGGNDALVKLGDASSRIVRGLFLSPPNDIMQAVTRGSLYADVLQENWKHQLNLYKIISFYEGIGSIVSRESATIGLPGDVENIVCIEADHSNMCCFNLSNNVDEDNFQLVSANIKELYKSAIDRRVDLSSRLPPVPTSNLREPRVAPSRDVGQLRSLQLPINVASHKTPSNLFPISVGQSYSGSEKLYLTKRILEYVPESMRPVTNDCTGAFYTYDYDQEYEMKARDRYQGTCEWLWRHKDYLWWRSTTAPSLLWLSGGSGLGKTTLLAHVVWQLRNLPTAFNSNELVLYSFCEAHINDDGGDIISVLIHQLLTTVPKLRNFASETVQQYDSAIRSTDRPEPKRMPTARLWRLLCDLIRKSKLRRVFLVIDALDECNKSSQMDLIHYFGNAAPSVRTLVSSRPNEKLRTAFSQWLARSPSSLRHLNADDEDESIKKDIEHYLAGEIDVICGTRGYSHHQKIDVRNHLREYCSGIFLIAKLMVKRLETAPVSDLSATLQETPKDLPILYSALLSEIPASFRSKRSEIFKVLMYTCEPLTVRELAFACHSWVSFPSDAPPPLIDNDYIKAFRKDLLLYGPMLKIRREDDVVSFIHPTVKEFLVGQSQEPGGSHRQFLVGPGAAQQEIAIACLRLLLSKSEVVIPGHWEFGYIEKVARVVEEHLLFSYALQYWYKHLVNAMQDIESLHKIDPELTHLVRSIQSLWRASHQVNFTALIMKCCGLHPIKAQHRISAFEFFSWLGLSTFIPTLLEDEQLTPLYPRLEDCVESALRLAIRGGHIDTVVAITDHFQITSLQDPGYEGIIADAAWSGHSGLVTRLQRMRTCDPSEFGQATTAAFATGSHQVLQSLIEDVASFQKRDEFAMTALHRIFFDGFGSEDWMATLANALFHVRNGVAVGAQDIFGNTALHYAAYSPGLGTSQLLKGLIREGADPTAANVFLWTPLHLAARRARSFDVLKTLLSTGGIAMLGSRTRGCSTPLHWAASRADQSSADESVIRGMLRYGGDPHAATLKGVTPIQIASSDPWMLGVFQTVYTQLDGVNHVLINWEDPKDPSILALEAELHGEPSEHDGESFVTASEFRDRSLLSLESRQYGETSGYDDESSVTSSRRDSPSSLIAGNKGNARKSRMKNINTQVKVKKTRFLNRLKWWR